MRFAESQPQPHEVTPPQGDLNLHGILPPETGELGSQHSPPPSAYAFSRHVEGPGTPTCWGHITRTQRSGWGAAVLMCDQETASLPIQCWDWPQETGIEWKPGLCSSKGRKDLTRGWSIKALITVRYGSSKSCILGSCWCHLHKGIISTTANNTTFAPKQHWVSKASRRCQFRWSVLPVIEPKPQTSGITPPVGGQQES